eukprot:g1550.t1
MTRKEKTVVALLCLAALLGAVNPAQPQEGAAPDVLWNSGPTGPGETVLIVLAGDGSRSSGARVVQLLMAGAESEPVEPILDMDNGSSVAFSIPTNWSFAAYQFRVCAGAPSENPCSQWIGLNNANTMWAQGDRGPHVTPGASIHIFGSSLGYAAQDGDDRLRCAHAVSEQALNSRVRLLPLPGSIHSGDAGDPIELKSIRGSCYDLKATVPEQAAPGAYFVQVLNGLPGSSWSQPSDQECNIMIAPPEPWPTLTLSVDGQFEGDIAAALAHADGIGGARVELSSGKTYSLGPYEQLYIPHHTVLSTEGGKAAANGRAHIVWSRAAPNPVQENSAASHPCVGPGSFPNSSELLKICPPLVWGNGTFALEHVHVKAPALSALVAILPPSKGARIVGSRLEVKGYSEVGEGSIRKYVNVSNSLWAANSSDFIVEDTIIEHVAEGAIAPGGQYGGSDTPAPCGQPSPNNYAFFFSQGSENALFRNNSIVMGCNGWGTQSSQNIVVEANEFRSVGLSGIGGSGFSSASTAPVAKQNALVRNTITGTNAATGKHKTPNRWANLTNFGPKADPLNPLEMVTSDGSYGGYFGAALSSNGTVIELSGPVAPNTKAPAALGWKRAALVVVDGKGLGQIRTITSAASHGETYVIIDSPMTTQLDSTSIITIVPWVGRWIVVGNRFQNGTSVQTYGSTLVAIVADNILSNMTRSAQVNPAGMCFTSLQYGTGIQPNLYVEVTRNTFVYSEGLHLRASMINGTSLTYGFMIRSNLFKHPPPLDYVLNPVLGPES